MAPTEATALVWFRNDLRLHDHYAWNNACKEYERVIGIYVIDPDFLHAKSPLSGHPKIGVHRIQFILETLKDLRNQLRLAGSELIVRVGKTIPTIIEVAKEHHTKGVFCHEEVTDEEVELDTQLETHLESEGIGLYMYWGSTLYHPDDLPFEPEQLPRGFTSFRKKVEARASIRALQPTLKPEISINEALTVDPIPTVRELHLAIEEEEIVPIPDSHFKLHGGESAALERLQHYVTSKAVRTYKETRNGLLGLDYSTKFSAWLSLGCISPRMIYHEIKKHEQEFGQNDSTYWVIFELIWRDFFRFTFLKEENRLFKHRGLLDPAQPNPSSKIDIERLEAWKLGRTGVPFIDANMRELLATGFMSNRGRQNVASYLVHVLQCDWRWGAEWFECMLIDYDPCSNWGNWAYVAGVGNDPRSRYFNVLKQAKDYDPKGDYVKYWIPEISPFGKDIHTPFRLTAEQWKLAGVLADIDYPLIKEDPEKVYQKLSRR